MSKTRLKNVNKPYGEGMARPRDDAVLRDKAAALVAISLPEIQRCDRGSAFFLPGLGTFWRELHVVGIVWV